MRSAVYESDGNAVGDLTAIEPYRDVVLTFGITADGGSVSYNKSLQTTHTSQTGHGTITGNPLRLQKTFSLVSLESGMFTLEVSSGSLRDSITLDIAAKSGTPPVRPPVGESNVYLKPEALTMEPGDTEIVEIRAKNADGEFVLFEDYEWTIGDPSIISVEPNPGVVIVTAKKAGTTKIRVDYATGDHGECMVTVGEKTHQSSKIELPNRLNLGSVPSEAFWISATLSSPLKANEAVEWHVDDGSFLQILELSSDTLRARVLPLKEGQGAVNVRLMNTAQNNAVISSSSCLVVVGRGNTGAGGGGGCNTGFIGLVALVSGVAALAGRKRT